MSTWDPWLARTILGAIVLAGAGAACKSQPQPPEVSQAAMDAHLRRESEGRLIHVRIRAAAASLAGPARLSIEEARITSGWPPTLLPVDGLAGRAELLDAGGSVRWSMPYVPAPDGEAISMRLPAIVGAASVRLIEPARNATVVAPISPLATP
jgi:hypothetical protein